MASYDAEIRVRTSLDNKTFKVEARKLEGSFDEIAKKADYARAKIEELEKAGTSKTSQQYKNAQKELLRLSDALEALVQKRDEAIGRMQRGWNPKKGDIGDDQNYKNLIASWEDMSQRTKDIQAQNWKFFADDSEKAEKSVVKIEEAIETARDKMRTLEELPQSPEIADLYQKAAEDLKRLSAELDAVKSKQAGAMAESTSDMNQLRTDVEVYANNLKELEAAGKYFGDADYDKQYLAWKNAANAVKEYQAELNKQTEKEKESANEAQRLAQIKANATISDQKMVALLERRGQIQAEIKELEQAGVTAGYREYDILLAKLEKINKQINSAKKNAEELSARMEKVGGSLKELLEKIQSPMQKALGMLTRRTNQSAKSVNAMRMSFIRMLAMSVAFSAVFRAISVVSAGLGQGFTALMKHSDSLADSVQSLKNALSTLGNSFAAAFSPIIQAAIPYLVQLINWVTRAVNAIGQLFAYLTGKSTWTKATEVQAGYNDELNGTADAAKKAYGALAKFDDLDVLQKQDSGSGSGGAGDAATGGFEEVPISEDVKKFGDKLKDIFSQLFAPLKEAWNREGKFVMDAWKYALEEIGLLVKDIGRDFLEVWNQEATIAMFEDILHIIGDIGLVVGNLAHNFREAWNENETGLHILENIRDIFAVIIHNIRLAADATVEWSETLDFSPLLTAVEKFTEALVPAFDALSGILTDFYTQVLLPLSKWVLEKGLPELLNVLTDFVEKVEWERLRKNFNNLWDSLEPFAETVGEGLIIFIERISDLVANFLNSEALEGFLDYLADWMDDVEPEDVADAIEWFAEALISLKVALAAVNAVVAVSKLVPLLSQLKAIGVVTAGVILVATGVEAFRQFAEDFKYIKENGFFDWQENNRENGKFSPWNVYDEYEPRDSEPYNPYEDMDFSWMDEWSQKFSEWQANNREKRDEEKAEFDTWFEELKLAFSQTFDNIKAYWSEKWDGVSTWFETNVEPWFTSERWTMLFDNIRLALQTKWNEIITWWQETALVAWWEENVAPWFTIEKWTELFNNIWLALQTKWTELVTWWQETALYTWWEENVAPWFAQEKWLELYAAVKDAIVEKWNEMVVWWQTNIKSWWDNNVAPWFTVEKWRKLGENMKEGIFSGFKGIVNKIVDILNEVISSVESMVNNAIEGINSLLSMINGSAIGEFFNLDLSLGNVSFGRIPRLASGAVIQGGNPFLAVLGDQRAGQTNIEAPLSTIRQAVRDELSGLGFGGGQMKVVLQVNGVDLAQATLQDFLSEMSRQGLDVEVLGVT